MRLVARSPDLWLAIEVVCTVEPRAESALHPAAEVFTAEYLTLLLTCRAAGISLVGFVLDPRSVAELVALLPFYVEVLLRSVGFGNTAALKAFRAAGRERGDTTRAQVVRLIRVLRVFKLGAVKGHRVHASCRPLRGRADDHVQGLGMWEMARWTCGGHMSRRWSTLDKRSPCCCSSYAPCGWSGPKSL